MKCTVYEMNWETGNLEPADVPNVDARNNLKIGTVLQQNGYNDSQFVIVKNRGISASFPEYGTRYTAIALDDGREGNFQALDLKHISQKKDNRIATYYTDNVVGTAEILELLEKHEQKKADDAAQEIAVKKAKIEIREHLFKEYAHLERAKTSKKTPWALGAANIRRELKKNFPDVKFSVRSESYSGGSSIHVNGPADIRDQAEDIINKYQEGDFNAMDDLYEYNGSQFPDLFGGAKYVFYNPYIA